MSWPFDLYTPPDGMDEDDLATMFGELRSFLGTVASAAPGADDVATLTRELRGWRERLTPHLTDDGAAPFGQLSVDHEHGLVSLPETVIVTESPGSVDATVLFSRWHVGGGGTVHGGQVATVLDAMMGQSQLAAGWIARTAYLNVSYRDGTPFGRPLTVEVRTTSTTGRKHFLRARLLDDGSLLAEAEALFVRVARYPGAPDSGASELPVAG